MTLPHGDYTELAQDYASFRAGYAPELPAALLGLASVDARGKHADHRALDFVDVGAGTGIWTRMVAALGCRTTAVEPNEKMLELGRRAAAGLEIDWRRGSAEQTGLPDGCCDLLTMASSFHWTDFALATAEFRRVLRPGGVFAALWNTRVVEAHPLLVEIEAELARRVPHLERVSSGKSAFCETLRQRLSESGRFTDVSYLEGRHVERLSPARYLGIWRSVNDVRVQAGPAVFAEFLSYVESRTRDLAFIDATYLTRAWAARVPYATR